MWQNVDELLPAGEHDRTAVRVADLFDLLRTDPHDEQTVLVIAWVELPVAGRELPVYEEKAEGLHAARKVADDHDQRVADRLASMARSRTLSRSASARPLRDQGLRPSRA